MIDTETTGELPENNEAEAPESDPALGLKTEIESLKTQNQELINRFEQLLATQKKTEVEKPMTAEEIKQLMEKDPQAAIQYALKSQVDLQVKQIEQNLTRQQQQQYYDTKVEQDFPLINKDQKFKELVKAEVAALVSDGMDRSSPKLVYKAAQIAALKHKAIAETKGESSAPTSEAPTNVKRNNSSSKGLPSNFDVLARAFGLNDKAKERAKENIRQQSERDERRRSRGY